MPDSFHADDSLAWEDHDAFFASENYRTLVNPDEARFIDMGSVAVMVTEEKKIM
ncbi:hypothetical protein ACFPC0_29200 [Streptomyces andamanensis]|uniref:Uncharacterized protein n=1 Tax=Streptomyces andamanensis TaxID=1565035 RepID=A0ABV8TMF9_9ACTN